MKYAIMGAGKIGTALARKFAAKNIEAGIANTRGPETLEVLRKELGSSVIPVSQHEACGAEVVFLAVPFSAHKDVAKQLTRWDGKIVVDTTNAMHVPPEALGGSLSSELVAEAFAGAEVVKAFNHLPAAQLGSHPPVPNERQAVFISSNYPKASAAIAALASELGFAPVELGRLDQGGVPLHFVEGKAGGLVFQNLAKVG